MANENKIGFLDLLIVILGRKYFFIISVLLFTIVGLILSLIMTKHYTAITEILPPQKQFTSILDNILPESQFSGLLKSLNMGGNSTDQFLGILHSNRLAEAVIDSLKLIPHYTGKKKQYFKEDVLRSFFRSVKIEENDFGNIEISVSDTNPKLAASIANTIVAKLDQISFEISTESAKNSRLFFEERLKEIKLAQDSSLGKLTQFQVTHNYIDLDQQVKSSIEALAKLEGNKMGLELQIAQLKNRLGSNNNQIRSLNEDHSVLEKQIQSYMENGSGDLILSLKNAPDLAVKYALLLREAKLQETLYHFAIQMYEQSKLSETNSIPSVQVLQIAEIPQKKSRPKRQIILLLFFFSGIIFSTMSILMEKWYLTQKEQTSEIFIKIQNVRNLLLRRSA